MSVVVVSELNFDVIFLDIDMPNFDGFETAKILNEKANCELVFVTNHEEFVFKAYKFKAINCVNIKWNCYNSVKEKMQFFSRRMQ
jgi:two-component system LytT family response regulator